LEQYHEKDATDVFWSFHGKEGHQRLANMKGVPVETIPNPKLESFRKLRQKLRDEGYFNPSPLWQSYKCISSVGLLAFAILLTFYGHWFIGAILFGIGYQQMGWLGHDACHHGLTSNRKLNNALGLFFGNFLSGFSVNWWKDRHNSHHAITNVLDSDPDVDNLPLFVWSEHDIPRSSTWPSFARSIVPYQHFYFVPWTATLKLIWCLQSIVFLRNPEIHNRPYTKSLPVERITIILHYIFLFFVLRLTPNFGAAALFFIISEFIGGAGIALIVFMNHYSCEQMPKSDGKEADFLTIQLYGTKNIDPGILMDWIAGGLNYQVEHHLFPTVPRHNLSKLKPIVETFCSENDLPYMSYSYAECLSAVINRLAHVAALYTKTCNSQAKINTN